MIKGIPKEKPKISVLIYGPSGAGKTTAITTLPAAKTLAIATEPQTPQRLALCGYKGQVWVPENFTDIENIYLDLQSLEKFDCIVVDSLTQIAEMCLSEIMDTRYPPINGIKQAIKPSFNDYGVLKIKMKCFVTGMTNANKNIIFLAREIEKSVLDGAALRVEVMIAGSISMEIFGHVLYVWRIVSTAEKGMFQNKLLTMAKPEFYAKGDPRLAEIETGQSGTVNLGQTLKKILKPNGGKK